MSNILTLSHKYLKLGYRIIPTIFKVPTKGFSHTDIDWDSYWPKELEDKQNGIGLLCGEESGVVALDIDVNDEALISHIRQIASSNVAKFGSKGITLFFQWEDFIKSESISYVVLDEEKKAQKVTVIDVLSSGKYSVIPPSKHKDGGFYEWRGIEELPPKDLLPTITKEQYQAVLNFCRKYASDKNQVTDNKIVASGGRNDSLKNIILKAYGREQFKKTEHELITYLTNLAYENDFSFSERLFTDEKEGFKAKNEGQALTNAKKFVTSIVASVLKNYKTSVVRDEDTPVDVFDDSFIDAEKLPSLTGDLNAIYSLLSSGLEVRNHNSIVGASIFCLSGLIGDKYKMDDGSAYLTTTNNYMCFVKKTGSGKSTILKLIKKFLENTEYGIFKPKFFGKFASAPAFCDAIDDMTLNFSDCDEFSTILKLINTQKGEISETMNALWDRPEKYFIPTSNTRTREKLKSELINPYISVYAATTESLFLENSTREMLYSGFYNRFLFIVDSKTTRGDLFFNQVDKEQFNEDVNYYLSITKPILPKTTVILKPDDSFIESIIKEKEEQALGGKNDDMIARRISHIQKLALLFGVSDNVQNPVINKKHFVMARDLLDVSFKNSVNLFDQVNSRNSYIRDEKKILDVLRSVKANGKVSYSVLKQRVNPESTMFDNILNNLEKNGIIEVIRGKRGGNQFKVTNY